MNYTMTTPCSNCPFRSDGKGIFLRSERVEEILESLERSTFPCHKTMRYDSDGERVETEESQHCAGALILLEKEERPSQMMKIAERLRMYDRTKLDMSAPVFDCSEDMLDQAECNDL